MKLLRIYTLIILSIFSLGISYGIITSATETYFFDKLYYQKSEEFGYIDNLDYLHSPLRISRMTGLPLLAQNPNSQVLGARGSASQGMQNSTETSHPYTIAVIGDSYVWGLGIKTKDRFSDILSSELNAIRPTQVYTLGKPTDNFLDNVSKYYLVSQHQKIDLYIFVIVFNDLLLLPKVQYPSSVQERIMTDCSAKGDNVYEYVTENWDEYLALLTKAWKSPAHRCFLEEGASLLPTNAIYLIGDGYWFDYTPYIDILQKKNLSVYELSGSTPGIEDYRKYWNDAEKYFHVSTAEDHPSKLANAMYARFLFHELTTNQKWGFLIPKKK